MPSAETQQRLAEYAPRTWQRMLSGCRLNLLEPSPDDIEIGDIALGLSRNSRWNGQTQGDHAWSVAQHSVFVVEILGSFTPCPPRSLLLAGLLHDASEYVTHDIITPLKAVVGDVFHEVERRLTRAIFQRFGLPAELSPADKALVKKADLLAAASEAVQLAGFSPEEVSSLLNIEARPLTGVSLIPQSSHQAEAAFLQEFARLTDCP